MNNSGNLIRLISSTPTTGMDARPPESTQSERDEHEKSEGEESLTPGDLFPVLQACQSDDAESIDDNADSTEDRGAESSISSPNECTNDDAETSRDVTEIDEETLPNDATSDDESLAPGDLFPVLKQKHATQEDPALTRIAGLRRNF